MAEPDRIPQQPDEMHFQICQRAAETLGRLVEGNGLRADQVRLGKHETLVHQVPGFIHVEFKPEVANKQYKGNVPQGKVVGAKENVFQEAAGLVRDVAQDNNVINQIMQDVQKDEGHGFAMERFTVPLPATTKEFSVISKCLKCNGQTQYSCTRCHAQGLVPCQTCAGQGFSQCPQCYGSGQYMRGGTERVACNRCMAQGRINCTACNGQRTLRCPACAGNRTIDCTECDRSGFWTNVYHLAFQANGEFMLDRQQIPPDVLSVIDTLGERNLATKGLAQIFRVGVQPKENVLTIPMLAFLPIANAEFTVEGKPYPAMIAGLPGRILTMQPILDAAIKPGINALYKLSKGPMAAEALVEQACKYRLIRQVLAGLTKQSKKQVYQQLTREYPVGLSEKYAKATIRYAEQAILAIGKGPRLKGLIMGSAATALISAIYFMSPLRPHLLSSMDQSGHARHMFVPDLGVWAFCLALTVFLIKFMAAGALKRLLPDSVQAEGHGLPAAGEEGRIAIATTFTAWLAVALLSASKPEWILALLHIH